MKTYNIRQDIISPNKVKYVNTTTVSEELEKLIKAIKELEPTFVFTEGEAATKTAKVQRYVQLATKYEGMINCLEEKRKQAERIQANVDRCIKKAEDVAAEQKVAKIKEEAFLDGMAGIKDARSKIENLKQTHPNAILIMREGEWYVVYDENDAKVVSEICGLTITNSTCQFKLEELDTMLSQLVKAGRRVAVCEPPLHDVKQFAPNTVEKIKKTHTNNHIGSAQERLDKYSKELAEKQEMLNDPDLGKKLKAEEIKALNKRVASLKRKIARAEKALASTK